MQIDEVFHILCDNMTMKPVEIVLRKGTGVGNEGE
jgi:hypothetical protein